MELRQSTLEQVASALRAGDLGRCFACGGMVRPGEAHVRLRGLVFHSGCARYRRRAAA